MVLHLDRLITIGGSTHPFNEYFRGFKKVEAVRKIFGARTEEVLDSLKVGFTWLGGYMWVNGGDGHLMVSSRYMNEGDRVDVYLDVIHELVHVKQLMEGRELFNLDFSYTERPTEVEAYRAAVEEARRLGLSDERICRYLRTEWMSEEGFEKFARAMGVNCRRG